MCGDTHAHQSAGCITESHAFITDRRAALGCEHRGAASEVGLIRQQVEKIKSTDLL